MRCGLSELTCRARLRRRAAVRRGGVRSSALGQQPVRESPRRRERSGDRSTHDARATCRRAPAVRPTWRAGSSSRTAHGHPQCASATSWLGARSGARAASGRVDERRRAPSGATRRTPAFTVVEAAEHASCRAVDATARASSRRLALGRRAGCRRRRGSHAAPPRERHVARTTDRPGCRAPLDEEHARGRTPRRAPRPRRRRGAGRRGPAAGARRARGGGRRSASISRAGCAERSPSTATRSPASRTVMRYARRRAEQPDHDRLLHVQAVLGLVEDDRLRARRSPRR